MISERHDKTGMAVLSCLSFSFHDRVTRGFRAPRFSLYQLVTWQAPIEANNLLASEMDIGGGLECWRVGVQKSVVDHSLLSVDYEHKFLWIFVEYCCIVEIVIGKQMEFAHCINFFIEKEIICLRYPT